MFAAGLGQLTLTATRAVAEDVTEGVAEAVQLSLFSRYGVMIGGSIAVVLIIAGVVVPLVMIDRIKASFNLRRMRKELQRVGQKYPWFQWKSIRDRVTLAVKRVSEARGNHDLAPAASYLSPEYYAREQKQLRKWVDEERQIVYRMHGLRRISPLVFHVEQEHEPSWIRVLVVVDLVDYMRDHYTQEVVHGEVDRQTAHASVWQFIYDGKQWVLNGIQDAKTVQAWSLTKSKADTTYLDYKLSKQRQQQRRGNAAAETV